MVLNENIKAYQSLKSQQIIEFADVRSRCRGWDVVRANFLGFNCQWTRKC